MYTDGKVHKSASGVFNTVCHNLTDIWISFISKYIFYIFIHTQIDQFAKVVMSKWNCSLQSSNHMQGKFLCKWLGLQNEHSFIKLYEYYLLFGKSMRGRKKKGKTFLYNYVDFAFSDQSLLYFLMWEN